ncbi:MAG: hypothetical protein K2K31_03445 [Clostridia bacterium]|nr:hypothetical protein [Clostridia bacterium]
MEKQIYITPELLTNKKIVNEVDLNSPYYISLFSKTGLIGNFTVQEFAFIRYLNSVLKLVAQLNKLDLKNIKAEDIKQEYINDAVFRLEVASLTQIDKENMTMKFDPKDFRDNRQGLSVLHVLNSSVIQYVALKHGLRVEDGLGFFLNNSSQGPRKLVPCEKVNDKNMFESIIKKLDIEDYSKLLPAENTDAPKAPTKPNIKDN